MSRCRQCNVEVLDDTQVCPLCNNVLEVEQPGENTYPNARIQVKRMKLFSNILLFALLAISITLGYLNYIFYEGLLWSLIGILGMVYLYMVFRFAIMGNSGYRKKSVILTATAIIYVIAIDMITGYHGWSVNFVLPGAIILVDIGIVVLMIVNWRNWQSYLLFQLCMIFGSIVTLILTALDIITNAIPSTTAFLFSVLIFMGTLIIGDRRARIELKRRFHVR